jgi:hypothetical protein
MMFPSSSMKSASEIPPFFKMVRFEPRFSASQTTSALFIPNSFAFSKDSDNSLVAYPFLRSEGLIPYPMWPPTSAVFLLTCALCLQPLKFFPSDQPAKRLN